MASRSNPPLRVRGDELISELFEACADLQLLGDSLAGADFILALLLEKIPSEIGVVSLFDIDKREFVVVRQRGGTRSILTTRTSERAPLVAAAMRRGRAVVIADVDADNRVDVERWTAAGIVPKSLVCTPVEVGGRYLGLVELANPIDEASFTDDDGHALTYVGEQYAALVADRGIVTRAEDVLRAVTKDHRP